MDLGEGNLEEEKDFAVGTGQLPKLAGEVLGKGANLQNEQELASQLVPVRRPDVEAAVVVSQCWRQADSCQGPGCLSQAAIQAIVT